MARASREAVSIALRFHILRRDSFTCQYCGAKAPDAALHVDHVMPVVDGGTNEPENLVAACVRCNIGKGTEAAKGGTPRPLTTREKTLERRADWWQASEHRSMWALTAFAGECHITRALLFYLAAIADPHGAIGLHFETISERLHLPPDVIRRAARGLIATGYLSTEEWGADEVMGEIHLGVPTTDSRGEGHLAPATLCPTLPEFFSSVAQIHG